MPIMRTLLTWHLGELKMQKIQAMITLVLLAATVSASLIGTVGFAAPAEPHGAISIAFDDSLRSPYEYAFPLMQARGMKATFYVVTDAIRDFSNSSAFLSIAELQTLQDYGCEIASHSKSHPAFTGISDSEIHYQCYYSKQFLQSYGLTVNNFAYPYGARNNHTDSIVAEYYRSARSAYVEAYAMQFPVSQFVLPAFEGETGNSSALFRLMNIVYDVYKTNGWAIVFFHNVVPDDPDSPYEISVQDFESFLDYIANSGVQTITVNQGLDLTSSPSPPPSVTISPNPETILIGHSQMFTSSISDGNPSFSYQWVFNDSAVLGATSPTWTFTPTNNGTFKIYLNVTDLLNNEVQSNTVEATVYSPTSSPTPTPEPTPEPTPTPTESPEPQFVPAGRELYIYLAAAAGLIVLLIGIVAFELKKRRARQGKIRVKVG
jgi:peptidoglycan/xylan/chitin deacetylase (PgdA/CDA1 family)